MPFSTDQRAELNKPLDRRHVKPPAPGKHGDYVEGWHVIAEANRIFGFDGWTRETVSMLETNRELLTLTGNRGDYQQWRVGYVAKVRISAGGIVREGTGFGSGISKPEALGEAVESAVKEAETDAMKRALMTFGNPFGLALYDKTKANVDNGATGPAAPQKAANQVFNSHEFQRRVAAANTKNALELLRKELQGCDETVLSEAAFTSLWNEIENRIIAISAPVAPKQSLDALDKALGTQQ